MTGLNRQPHKPDVETFGTFHQEESLDGEPLHLLAIDHCITDGVTTTRPFGARAMFEIFENVTNEKHTYHYRPGNPIDEDAWIRHGWITTRKGTL